MTDKNSVAPGPLDAIEASWAQADTRRRFMSWAGGAAAAGGIAALSACGGNSPSPSPSPTATATPTPTPSASGTPTVPTLDIDLLNFALNLEYLTAQFYVTAVSGAGLPAGQVTGVGTQGAVTGGRAVVFTDPIVAEYAREIAADNAAHVAFLRTTLDTAAVAQPAINIDGGTTGAFTQLMRLAGVVDATTGVFDPYASDENFLLAAFVLADVMVTAYKGASPLITTRTIVDAGAGILGTQAYHAGLIRTTLYRKGLGTPALQLIENTTKISNARDGLDGGGDLDQGVASPDSGTTSNIVPADGNALAYSRTTGQVLNVLYLTKTAASLGGFYPAGLNGNIKTATLQP